MRQPLRLIRQLAPGEGPSHGSSARPHSNERGAIEGADIMVSARAVAATSTPASPRASTPTMLASDGARTT